MSSDDYKYQLIFQFRTDGLSNLDIDRVFKFEIAMHRMAGSFIVDGNDIGPTEMNVFFHTNDPNGTFNDVRTFVPADIPWCAAYRDFDSEDYVVLYPEKLEEFVVS